MHECYKHGKKNADARVSNFLHTFDEAVESNRELENLLTKAQVGTLQKFSTFK